MPFLGSIFHCRSRMNPPRVCAIRFKRLKLCREASGCWSLKCMKVWFWRLRKVFRRFLFLFKFHAFDFCWIFQLQFSPVSPFWFIPHNPENGEREWKKPAVLKVSVWVISASSALGSGSAVQRKFRVHGVGVVGCLSRGKPRAWSEVIRRRFWQCPGCRRWPGCCVGCQVWGQAMGGGSRQACWRAVWGCWWWQRWNLVPRSSASGRPSERSDWNDWRETNTHIILMRNKTTNENCRWEEMPQTQFVLILQPKWNYFRNMRKEEQKQMISELSQRLSCYSCLHC